MVAVWTVNTHLVSWSAPQAVRVELVGVEDMDGALDAQMMELTGDLQEQQVILQLMRDDDINDVWKIKASAMLASGYGRVGQLLDLPL